METDIQKLLDSDSDVVILPPGEFKGAFTINRPCTVEGSNTTLWNDSDTVLTVNSKNVILKNIHVELVAVRKNCFSVLTGFDDTVYENIEVYGPVHGFGPEDSVPEISRQIKLGNFCSEFENSFVLDLYIPNTSPSLSVSVKDIKIENNSYTAGINKIKLKTGEMAPKTFIYGNLILNTGFIRNYYFSGLAENNGEKCVDKILSEIDPSSVNEDIVDLSSQIPAMPRIENTPSKVLKMHDPDPYSDYESYHTQDSRKKPAQNIGQNNNFQYNKQSNIHQQNNFNRQNVQYPQGRVQQPIQNAPVPQRAVNSPSGSNFQGGRVNSAYILKRGERIFIDSFAGQPFSIIMGCRGLYKKMDIDPYVFLLNKNETTTCDEDFIYFGNRSSRNNAVRMNNDASFSVDLNLLPDDIEKIAFVFSIYNPKENDNFSKVSEPFISVCQNRSELFRYAAFDLFAETTIIFMSIYRYNSKWKLNTVGQGYREGLKRLCSQYGLNVQ